MIVNNSRKSQKHMSSEKDKTFMTENLLDLKPDDSPLKIMDGFNKKDFYEIV